MCLVGLIFFSPKNMFKALKDVPGRSQPTRATHREAKLLALLQTGGYIKGAPPGILALLYILCSVRHDTTVAAVSMFNRVKGFIEGRLATSDYPMTCTSMSQLRKALTSAEGTHSDKFARILRAFLGADVDIEWLQINTLTPETLPQMFAWVNFAQTPTRQTPESLSFIADILHALYNEVGETSPETPPEDTSPETSSETASETASKASEGTKG